MPQYIFEIAAYRRVEVDADDVDAAREQAERLTNSESEPEVILGLRTWVGTYDGDVDLIEVDGQEP